MKTKPTPKTRPGRAGGGDAEARGRESVILATLLSHPELIEAHDGEVAALRFTCRDLDAIRMAMLSAAGEIIAAGAEPDIDTLAARIGARTGGDPREALARAPLVSQMRYARPDASLKAAKQGLRDVLTRHIAQTARILEAGEAEAVASSADEDHVTERLRATLESELAANKLPEDDTGTVQEGASELQRLIDERIWEKKKNRRDSDRK